MYSIHLTRNMDTTLTVLVSLWSIKFMWTFLLRGTRKPKNARLVGNISEIHIFPVKSMKGIQLSSAECLFQGLKYPKLDIIDRLANYTACAISFCIFIPTITEQLNLNCKLMGSSLCNKHREYCSLLRKTRAV